MKKVSRSKKSVLHKEQKRSAGHQSISGIAPSTPTTHHAGQQNPCELGDPPSYTWRLKKCVFHGKINKTSGRFSSKPCLEAQRLKQLQACASWPIRRFVRNDDWVTHGKNMYPAWVYVSIHHEYPTNILLIILTVVLQCGMHMFSMEVFSTYLLVVHMQELAHWGAPMLGPLHANLGGFNQSSSWLPSGVIKRGLKIHHWYPFSQL